MGEVKMTISIPPKTRSDIKILAAKKGVTIKEIVNGCLLAYLRGGDSDTSTEGFYVLHELFDSGLWASLSLKAKAVFPVVLRHLSLDRSPSCRIIACEAGITRKSVVLAIKELELKAGLSSEKRAGEVTAYSFSWDKFLPGAENDSSK